MGSVRRVLSRARECSAMSQSVRRAEVVSVISNMVGIFLLRSDLVFSDGRNIIPISLASSSGQDC